MHFEGLPAVEGVTHRAVKLGDLRVHVAEAGPTTGTPLVLLHGWPNHWYLWRALVPLLPGRRLVMPDLRGFGWTDAPRGSYAKRVLRDDLLGLLDRLGFDRVDLVGHDWGGWTGFLACLGAPHRFRRFVGVNITSPHTLPTSVSLRVARRFAYMLAISTPFVGRQIVQRTPFVRELIRQATSRGKPDGAVYAERFADPARARATVRLYRTFLTREVPALLRAPERRRLEVPTRVLLGQRDPAIRPSMLEGHERWASGLEVHVREGVGHFLPEEDPEWVAEHVRDHCAP